MTEKFYFTPATSEQLQKQYDLVIIGSGGAGLTAALQACDLGLKPVVFEKMERLGGNTNRASSGMNAAESNVQLKHGIIDDANDFYYETLIGGGKLNDRELLAYFANHSALAISWLREHRILLDDLTLTGAMSQPRTHRPASTAPIGAFMITSMLKLLQEKGVQIFNQMQVTQLLQDETNQIVGLKLIDQAKQVHEIQTKAIILASGGFGSSKQLISKYRPDLAHYKTTNQPGATGDGLALATAVGAQLRDMNLIQIHPTVQQDNPHVYLIGEAVRGEGAILVDENGRRFVNELATRKVVSDAISHLPAKSAYLVFGKEVFDRVKALAFYQQIGLVESGPTIAALADKINVAAQELETTLATWNQSVAAKDDSIFNRTTGMQVGIKQAPFYAIHIAPAIHYTMGGLHIDTKAQVLDQSGQPILGLYAAGEVTGGLHGNNRIGGNSIAETVVFGRQAALQAVKYLKK